MAEPRVAASLRPTLSVLMDAHQSGCRDLRTRCGESRHEPLHQRRSSSWRIILSISAFESAAYVRETVENALAFTENTTLVVLHLDANRNYSNDGSTAEQRAARQHIDYLRSNARVEVNACFRQPMSVYSGTVVLSQLANLQWARCRGLLSSATTHVVFQASNMWWWRRGMEAVVRARNSSVPRLRTMDECAAFNDAELDDGAQQVCSPLHTSAEATIFVAASTSSAAGRASTAQFEPARHGLHVARQRAIAHELHLLRCRTPPFEGLRFTVVTKHEGSFYTVAAHGSHRPPALPLRSVHSYYH
jgi:hypothetical protein